jgi:hypothetical protein
MLPDQWENAEHAPSSVGVNDVTKLAYSCIFPFIPVSRSRNPVSSGPLEDGTYARLVT